MKPPVIAILFFLSSAPQLLAVDKDRIVRQAKLLTDRLTQEHVKPPALDDSFGKSVHQLVVDQLDPRKVIFTSEDVARFERLAAGIDDDIRGQQLVYLADVEATFRVRNAALLKLTRSFLAQPVPLQSTVVKRKAELDRFWTESRQDEKWRLLLQSDMINYLIDRLEETETTFQPDSLRAFETAGRDQLLQIYSRYFEELEADEQLFENCYLLAISLSFDPHSLYFSPSDKKAFEQELTPDRELFGISYGRDPGNGIVITDIVPGSPAWLSNALHEGDLLLSIRFGEGAVVDLSGGKVSPRELGRLFDTGNPKTIELEVADAEGKKQKLQLTKEKVYSDADIIKNAVLHADRKIGYITLPDFYVNWTDTSALGCANDMAKCIIKLTRENIEGLILDLRGNGGGSLREAVDLSGIFVDYGPILATTDKTGNVELYKDFNRGSVYNGPFIILVDAESASASEVVAGVLQDYRKAVIVGQRTFGKATSQSIFPLDPAFNTLSAAFVTENPDFGYANITGGILYRVTRSWNQKCGVQPDVPLTFFSEEEQTGERAYPNALEPDSISKKIMFQPAEPLPTRQLAGLSRERFKADPQWTDFRQLVAELEAMETADTVIAFNLNQRLNDRNRTISLTRKLEAFYQNMNVNFEPRPNQFDEEVYKFNEVLRMYNDRFMDRLRQDVELMETVNIMLDLIASPK